MIYAEIGMVGGSVGSTHLCVECSSVKSNYILPK